MSQFLLTNVLPRYNFSVKFQYYEIQKFCAEDLTAHQLATAFSLLSSPFALLRNLASF